ncbi:hypothetical protein D3C80_1342360 [compost metagenome]
MCYSQHERNVGARNDRQPFRIHFRRKVVLKRGDGHEPGAASTGAGQFRPHDMSSYTATMHVGVLNRHSAEGDDEFCAALDRIPGDALAVDRVIRPQYMRDNDRCRAGTVGVDGSHVTAEHV